MLKHQQYTAWISVGGQPLETYAVETSPETNEVTCWIASEVGKEFQVHFQDTSVTRAHSIGVHVSIDGQQCGAYSWPNSAKSYAISDVQVSNMTAKSFMFSTVRLTDEDEFVDVSSAGLGQIQIKVHSIVVGHAMLPKAYQLQTEHKVHERSKKAVTHCVGLGREVARSRPWFLSQVIGQPLAIFTFKYRDSNLLMANGIIPVPAPLKRKASEDVIDLTIPDVNVESSRSDALSRGERISHRTKTSNGSKKVKHEETSGSSKKVKHEETSGSSKSNALAREERISHKTKTTNRGKKVKHEETSGDSLEVIDLT